MRMQLCVLALACSVGLAQAKGTDSAALGKTLTPMGSEMAANADGSIPAWSGGLASNAGTVDSKGGYSDPYAADKPLFTITAQNLAQYQKFLSPGQIALFKRFPDSCPRKCWRPAATTSPKPAWPTAAMACTTMRGAFRFRCPPKAWR